MHGAMYDSRAAILPDRRPFFVSRSVLAGLPMIAALTAAAYVTAINLYPSRVATFQSVYDQILETVRESSDRAVAVELGRQIGEAWIDWRTGDGSSTSLPYIPSTKPGAWRRTPPFF